MVPVAIRVSQPGWVACVSKLYTNKPVPVIDGAPKMLNILLSGDATGIPNVTELFIG